MASDSNHQGGKDRQAMSHVIAVCLLSARIGMCQGLWYVMWTIEVVFPEAIIIIKLSPEVH